MSKQTINLGTIPSGVGGDTPRSAFTKTQANFDEIYTALGGTTIPTTLPLDRGGTGKTCMGAAGVGTVSQSGGIPTGAIIEQGSNANGTYIKFASGIMICIGPVATFSVPANTLTASPLATFAAPFIDGLFTPYMYGAPTINGQVYGFQYVTSLSTTYFGMAYYNGPSAQQVTNCRYSAIGRWF